MPLPLTYLDGLSVVGPTGPEGPAGPAGPTGPAGSFYTDDQWHSGAWVDLSTNASTEILTVDIKASGYTLTPSHSFVAVLGVRVFLYLTSNRAIAGAMDLTVLVNLVTNGSSVVTCTFNIPPVPDYSLLPTGLSGATCTISASSGGFTISATRPTGTQCGAFARVWVNQFEDVS